MPFRNQVDLRLGVNAISDVVQNRPRPLRKFDQIYVKAGDMVSQSEIVADWAHDRRIAFVGDGDAISVCVAYLRNRGIIDFGPSRSGSVRAGEGTTVQFRAASRPLVVADRLWAAAVPCGRHCATSSPKR